MNKRTQNSIQLNEIKSCAYPITGSSHTKMHTKMQTAENTKCEQLKTQDAFTSVHDEDAQGGQRLVV